MIRVAINGFGRIGRAFVRVAHRVGGIEIVGINDLAETTNLAYLLKYDSVYGRAPFKVSADGDTLTVGEWKVPIIHEKDPAKLPWGQLNVDVVIESTGFFTEYAKAKAHITSGAKRVVISAPAKGDAVDGLQVLMGVDTHKLTQVNVTSNASCTTNAANPLIAILQEKVGIDKALLNTTHAYTATQMIVDGPGGIKDMRRGRAGAQNIVPSSTGAAKATTEAHTALKGKFDGISLRVPVPAGSMADITFIAKRDTTVEEINSILKEAAKDPRWKGIFTVTDEELVSTDIIGNLHASIADLTMTRVIGNLVKVLAWYDNEMGYTHTLVRHALEAGKVGRV